MATQGFKEGFTMVAWWLRAVTVLNVALLVVWLAWAWPQSPAWALAGAVVWLLAGRAWLALQFVCATAVCRSVGEPAVPWGVVLRAWDAECKLSLRAFAWDMPWAEHEQADYVPHPSVHGGGVVLVHGWLCNRAMLADALYRLRVAGVPCVAVSMPILLHRIGTGRSVLDAAAQRIYQATGRRPVVVAHSMGGLVVRDWLRSLHDPQLAHRPQAVVTVGSPHQGAWTAYWAMGPNVTQMRPGSAWLQQLQAEEARTGSAAQQVQWHCVFSEVDNMVFPSSTAVLPGAQVLRLHGMGHVQMLQSPRLWTLVQQLVQEQPVTVRSETSATKTEAAAGPVEPNSII